MQRLAAALLRNGCLAKVIWWAIATLFPRTPPAQSGQGMGQAIQLRLNQSQHLSICLMWLINNLSTVRDTLFLSNECRREQLALTCGCWLQPSHHVPALLLPCENMGKRCSGQGSSLSNQLHLLIGQRLCLGRYIYMEGCSQEARPAAAAMRARPEDKARGANLDQNPKPSADLAAASCWCQECLSRYCHCWIAP